MVASATAGAGIIQIQLPEPSKRPPTNRQRKLAKRGAKPPRGLVATATVLSPREIPARLGQGSSGDMQFSGDRLCDQRLLRAISKSARKPPAFTNDELRKLRDKSARVTCSEPWSEHSVRMLVAAGVLPSSDGIARTMKVMGIYPPPPDMGRDDSKRKRAERMAPCRCERCDGNRLWPRHYIGSSGHSKECEYGLRWQEAMDDEAAERNTTAQQDAYDPGFAFEQDQRRLFAMTGFIWAEVRHKPFRRDSDQPEDLAKLVRECGHALESYADAGGRRGNQ